MKKILILIIGFFILIISAICIYFFGILGYGKISFDYENRTIATVIDTQDTKKLKADGYVINFPNFYNNHPTSIKNIALMYDGINGDCCLYASGISDKYRNYAKLDYIVTVDSDDTLTISFKGFGYPDDGKGQPEELSKNFVYSIRNVSPDNPPTPIM